MGNNQTKEKEVARDIIKKQMLKCFEKDDYIEIARSSKVRIPGFTERNYHKVPNVLLKNAVEQRINNVRYFDQFIRQFVKHIKNSITIETIEQFIAQMMLYENITPAKKLVLFYQEFPEEYKDNIELINKNIAEKNFPLKDIVELSFKHNAGVANESIEEKLKEYSQEILGYIHPESVPRLFENEPSEDIEVLLNNMTLPNPGDGHYIQTYNEFYNQIKSLPEQTLSIFKKLIISDLVIIGSKLVKKHKDLEDTNTTIHKNFIQKESEMNDDLKSHTSTIKELNKKINRLEGTLDENFKNQNKLIEEYELHIKALEKENEYTTKSLKQETKNREELELTLANYQQNILLQDEHIYFHTSVQADLFQMTFTKKQLVHFKNITDLRKEITNNSDDAIHFINCEGISVKDIFIIENLFRKLNKTYRLVSGRATQVIKKIIYYLEGELHYETNTTN